MTAETTASITANVGTEVVAKAANDFALVDLIEKKGGAAGSSAGGVLASNKVNSMASAFIESRKYDYDPADYSADDGDGDNDGDDADEYNDDTVFLLPGDRVNVAGTIYEYMNQNLWTQIMELDPTGLLRKGQDFLTNLGVGSIFLADEDFMDTNHWKVVNYVANVGRTIAGTGISLTAKDNASIDSESTVISKASAVNNLNALVSLAVGLLDANDYQYTTPRVIEI